MQSLIPMYSKSSVEVDWTCPRKRYWSHEYLGVGLSKPTQGLELFMGSALHDALAVIAICHKQGDPVDIDLLGQTAWTQIVEALSKATEGEQGSEEFACEQAALAEGLIRGYYKHVWPRLIAQFPVVKFVEQHCLYIHDGLGFMAKPDLVLGTETGENWYIEYKSTSSKKDQWVNSWNTAVQLHSTCKAIEAQTGETMTGVIVQGLYKGYESYGKQSSPMCYAYKKNGNPPFTQDQISYEYKAGFKRYPTWELEGGVKGWVESMPEDVLANQFPQTLPIFINEDLVGSFFAQRAMREKEIKMASNDLQLSISDDLKRRILDDVFPQVWSACSPPWGHGCPYQKLCFGSVQDPLQEGYELRNVEHQKGFIELLPVDK